jgi:hypothetical protein
MGPERLDRVARDLVALDPADGLLDVVVEILHADGGAVHADLGQRGEAGLVDLVGVDLDGKLGALGQRHRLGDRSGKRAHHGRAAARSACRRPNGDGRS